MRSVTSRKARRPALRLVSSSRRESCEPIEYSSFGASSFSGPSSSWYSARRARAQRDLAPVGFDEQPHFADEFAGAEITQHQFAAVVLLGDDAHRTGDDVIERAGRIARTEHVGARRIPAAMALAEETFERGRVGLQRTDGAAERSLVRGKGRAHGRDIQPCNGGSSKLRRKG
jgi:hypothetical protein